MVWAHWKLEPFDRKSLFWARSFCLHGDWPLVSIFEFKISWLLKIPFWEIVDGSHLPCKFEKPVAQMRGDTALYFRIRSYLSTIPTYNSHLNSHFLLSRSGNSFLKNSHFSKKNSHFYLIKVGINSGNFR